MDAVRTVPGTPRWAVVAAWVALASVVPSGVWRTAVGVGVDLGWSEEQLSFEQIPGRGTGYVIGLTLASLLAAALTLGLVQAWGEQLPPWLPVLGGRRVPTWLVIGCAGLGVLATAYIVIGSVVNWSSVSGFADRPTSPPALVMIACYAPAALWPITLGACLVAYVARRHRGPRAAGLNRRRTPGAARP